MLFGISVDSIVGFPLDSLHPSIIVACFLHDRAFRLSPAPLQRSTTVPLKLIIGCYVCSISSLRPIPHYLGANFYLPFCFIRGSSPPPPWAVFRRHGHHHRTSFLSIPIVEHSCIESVAATTVGSITKPVNETVVVRPSHRCKQMIRATRCALKSNHQESSNYGSIIWLHYILQPSDTNRVGQDSI